MYFLCVDKIKDYFGVKIALYFAYLGHYTLALCMPAFVGLGIWVTQWQADQVSEGFSPLRDPTVPSSKTINFHPWSKVNIFYRNLIHKQFFLPITCINLNFYSSMNCFRRLTGKETHKTCVDEH